LTVKSKLSEEQIDNIIDIALAEDLSRGDITTEALVPPELWGKAAILVKGKGMLAGEEVAKRVFLKVDPLLKVEVLVKDGAKVQPGDIVATVSGKVISILKAERVALNFLQRLSGIAYSLYIRICGQYNRHPQDHARLKAAGKIRRAHGGWEKPPPSPR